MNAETQPYAIKHNGNTIVVSDHATCIDYLTARYHEGRIDEYDLFYATVDHELGVTIGSPCSFFLEAA